MVEVKVSRTLPAAAGKVWEYLSWRGVGNLRGDVFFDRILFEDNLNAVGSIRVLHLKDGSVIREVAEDLNDQERWYVYRPLDLGSLPVKDYRGRVSVSALAPDQCQVTISSHCTPVNISEAEWRQLYTDMEMAVIDLVWANVQNARS